MMKKLLAFCTLLTLAACSSRTGNLTGVIGRPAFNPEVPLGMVYVPAGSYNTGETDEDTPFLHNTRSKTVSVQAFYMDQTEITNNEYRQFVEYVRDSIARELIYNNADIEDDYANEWIGYQDTYFDEGQLEFVEFDPTDRAGNGERFTLNWDRKLDYLGEENMKALVSMYYPEAERFYRNRQIDARKLLFKYYWMDLTEAARRGTIDIIPDGFDNTGAKVIPEHRELNNGLDPWTKEPQGMDLDEMGFPNKKGQHNAIRGHENRSRFIIDETINVFPDTLCWVRDFTYSFHDPMTRNYFWHPAYDNYPVVGVTWQQCRAFNVWRTHLLNDWLTVMGEVTVDDFRLPTEAEWERGSRGDLSLSSYPWGGPYIRNEAGCFLGNFKPMRGRYFEDGGFHSVKAFSYNPNGWGLYCMAGNVAEWCETAFSESMNEFSHDLNTEYRYDAKDWDPIVQKRKVIRGGSWKDVGYYLQNSTRSYEYQDTAKCYVGFRSVQTHLGRGGRDMSKEGNEELGDDINLK